LGEIKPNEISSTTSWISPSVIYALSLARQCVANLTFLCLVSVASKVMDRAFSTLFNRNAATALSSIAIMQIKA
jgi:hypothetical protein